MSFEIRQVDQHNIWHFLFNTQYECAMSFIRLQEFYESPDNQIKMMYCTLEDLIDREVAEKKEWTFYDDWDGFNIPGHIVDFFFQKFEELRPREDVMLEALEQACPDRPYYIIGTGKNSAKSTLRHEIRHGLWYLYDDYKREMLNIIESHNTKSLRTGLKKMGYCEEVIDDEIQAYVLTGLDDSLDKIDIKVLRKELKKVEKKFL